MFRFLKYGVLIRHPVDLGFIPLVESCQKILKNGIHSFHAWRSAFRVVVESKPASSLVFLGKALNGTPPHLCGRQVAQTPQKWQLPREFRLRVQNIAIQFALSWIEDNQTIQYKKVKPSEHEIKSVGKKNSNISQYRCKAIWFYAWWRNEQCINCCEKNVETTKHV